MGRAGFVAMESVRALFWGRCFRVAAFRKYGRDGIVRFLDFIIFLAAVITAGSTFAMAVEMIVGWDDAVPVIEKAWDDSGLEKFLPADEESSGGAGEGAATGTSSTQAQ